MNFYDVCSGSLSCLRVLLGPVEQFTNICRLIWPFCSSALNTAMLCSLKWEEKYFVVIVSRVSTVCKGGHCNNHQHEIHHTRYHSFQPSSVRVPAGVSLAIFSSLTAIRTDHPTSTNSRFSKLDKYFSENSS